MGFTRVLLGNTGNIGQYTTLNNTNYDHNVLTANLENYIFLYTGKNYASTTFYYHYFFFNLSFRKVYQVHMHDTFNFRKYINAHA